MAGKNRLEDAKVTIFVQLKQHGITACIHPLSSLPLSICIYLFFLHFPLFPYLTLSFIVCLVSLNFYLSSSLYVYLLRCYQPLCLPSYLTLSIKKILSILLSSCYLSIPIPQFLNLQIIFPQTHSTTTPLGITWTRAIFNAWNPAPVGTQLLFTPMAALQHLHIGETRCDPSIFETIHLRGCTRQLCESTMVSMRLKRKSLSILAN